LIVAILEWVIQDKNRRLLIFSLLIGFSVGWQILKFNDFRWAWDKETNFYQQLVWRAPYVEPGTAFLSSEEFLTFMGTYPTSFALNSLYPLTETREDAPYWLFEISDDFGGNVDRLIEGDSVQVTKYNTTFEAKGTNSLVIVFQPEEGQCLWVLRPEDKDIRILPDLIEPALPLSNLDRIHNDLPPGGTYFDEILSPDAVNPWCYFYQKGDLARQFHEWDQVISLWEEAQQEGWKPTNGVEYLPFIEGYIRQEDWEQAQSMTKRANQLTRAMEPALCSLWQGVLAEYDTPPNAGDVLPWISDYLECGLLLE